ncbi:hypothetical protein IFM89_039350 [Coptis chinensis]|uniref:Protein CHUP1, chloroplastic n=1 Tax=Coptis chinensis TaxID=261450 RepID=A0A835HSE5_9MAGN|nr:hypothetical protein IFM89_039350 [Coptis chinensis]
MENSGRQSELMKPIILKAGIPLALSLAGFWYSMITSRKKLHVGRATEEGHQVSRNDETEAQDDNRDHNSTQGLNSTSLACTEGGVHMGNIQTKDSYISLQIRYRPETEEEILGLMKQVKALQHKEQELERRFVSFCGLKEQELALTKLQNLLVLKQAHLDFLGMTIESREAERRKFELMVVEYLRVLKQLESARLDNGMLQKKAKKLLRVTRKYSNVVLRQASMLQAREAEISTSHEELQGKTQVIVELNDRIMVLEILVDKYQQEKKELAEKLELAETSASSVSKKESEDTGVYVHDQLITELEQLQKDRAAEAEELVYLRWINACFRHELTRNQEEEHEHEERDDSIVLEDEVKHGILRYDSDPSSTIADQDESRALIMTTSHKKPKLLGKLRRWVRGSEACRRSWQHEHLYDKIRSVSHGAAKQHINARKSSSSA